MHDSTLICYLMENDFYTRFFALQNPDFDMLQEFLIFFTLALGLASKYPKNSVTYQNRVFEGRQVSY